MSFLFHPIYFRVTEHDPHANGNFDIWNFFYSKYANQWCYMIVTQFLSTSFLRILAEVEETCIIIFQLETIDHY